MRYEIKKGIHYASPLCLIDKAKSTTICTTRRMVKRVCFEHNCQYDIDTDQSDINKLFGFSLGYHHENSFRVGWRFFGGRLELVSYVYENGVRLKEQHICYCNFCEYYNIGVEIIVEHNKYKVIYTINGREAFVPSYHFADVKKYISYPLSVYFGGNRRAPHDMTIYLIDLKDEARN